MARSIPTPTSGRSIPAPAAGGGTPAGGDPWKDWTSLPIDMTTGWTRHNGSGSGNFSFAKTTDGSGDLLTVRMHGANDTTSIAMQNTGATKNGAFLIRNIHIKPYALSGLVQPAGQPVQQIDSEQFLIKLAVEFDTTAITGTSEDNYGNVIQVDAGMMYYSSDQSGSPAAPGNLHNAASVWKSSVIPTSAANVMKSGHNNYSGRNHSWSKWKSQTGHTTTGNDTIVFIAGLPLPSARNLSQQMIGGAVSSINPFSNPATGGATNASTTAWQNDMYCHFYLSFGGYTNGTTRGVVKIRKIRFLCQPVTGRVNFEDA
tara:strand:- start:690 stop:1634 length:945 start_codon:yes stop_codon:yes gene_type:complete